MVFNVKTTTVTTTTRRRACAFFHSPSSRRGHLVYTVCSMQFVRTAQLKYKHFIALSMEDGEASRPPRPEPLYTIIVSPNHTTIEAYSLEHKERYCYKD